MNLKFDTLKTILIAIIGLLIILWGVKSFLGNSSPKKTSLSASSTANSSNQELSFSNHEELKEFMRKEVDKPIPSDYEIPSYITSKLEKDSVYAVFGTRYPEFYGFGSTQLLDSAMRHPNRYVEMLTENKAIRRYYDPQSKY